VRFGRLPQKVRHGTQYSRSAEPALQRMMLREGALHLVERARLGQALHGHDIRAVCLRSVLRTAAHCYSIDQNRTSSAYPMLTADVNSEGLKLMTQEIAEEHARLGLARSALPIQCYLERKALAGCTMQDCHCRRFLAMSSAAFTARSTSTFVSAVRQSALAERSSIGVTPEAACADRLARISPSARP